MIARQAGAGLAEVAGEAPADIPGKSSLKAALDCDWDDPQACRATLAKVLTTLEAVEASLEQRRGWRDAARTQEPQ